MWQRGFCRYLQPRPFPRLPNPDCALGRGRGHGTKPSQVAAVPRPLLPKCHHFRRVRLASCPRGMAALRSWLSRSVSSLSRYRWGRVGQDLTESGNAESPVTRLQPQRCGLALRFSAERVTASRPSRRFEDALPLLRSEASSLPGQARTSRPTDAFFVVHLPKEHSPTSGCLLGASRSAREMTSVGLLKSQGRIKGRGLSWRWLAGGSFPGGRRSSGSVRLPSRPGSPRSACGLHVESQGLSDPLQPRSEDRR